MNQSDMEFVGELVHRRSGLVLSADKAYLLESRLGPVARREGFTSIEAMIATLRTRRDERLAVLVTEAMTTNETFFFRDKTPFDNFKDYMLPQLLKARQPGAPIRIWCAACSSGQEPYSLAMIIDEMLPQLGGHRVEIVATDISSQVLEKAKAGIYSQFEVQRGLPVKLLVKHFEQQGEVWRVRPELKRFISFQTLNLLDDFKRLGQFDVIYCRNVLIYFDQPTKKDVLARMAAQTPRDGFLVLGAAETVMNLSNDFVSVKARRGLYERPGAVASQVA
jgi:chemotaxis protein methyltransferase CheR